MRNTFLKTIGGTMLTILMLATFANISVSAQDVLNNPQMEDGRFRLPVNSRDLEGTWNAQVTVRICQTGVPISTFPAMATFMFGGTAIVSEAGVPPSKKTPAHGIWSHDGFNTYRFKTKAFNFDEGGNFTGWLIINQEANLNRRADKYESSGTAELYNTNGILIFTGCSTTTATRLE